MGLNLADNAIIKAAAGRHAGTTGLTVTGAVIEMPPGGEVLTALLRIATSVASGAQITLAHYHGATTVSSDMVATTASQTVTVSTGATEAGNVITSEIIRPRKPYNRFDVSNPSTAAAAADGVIAVISGVRKAPVTQSPIAAQTWVSPSS